MKRVLQMILVLIIILLSAISSYGDDNELVIYKTDGTTSTMSLEDIDRFEFVLPPAAPTNLSVIEIDLDAFLIWDDSETDGVTYSVYRTTEDEEYGEALATGLTDNYYTDETVAENEKYYYVVTAVKDEMESNYSEEVIFEFKVIEISRIDYLPQNIDLQENGTAYLYYNLYIGDDFEYNDTPFEIEINRYNPNKTAITCEAVFIDSALVRLAIPSNLITSDNTFEKFVPEDDLSIDGEVLPIVLNPEYYQLKKVPMQYKRKFDVFAGASAGVSGTLGSVGLGVSASAAKLSVKGQAGAGMTFEYDHNDNFVISRRVEAGIGAELKIPDVNAIADEAVEVNAIQASVIAKSLIEQTITASDLNIDDDVKQMIETGFFLETAALGGLTLGPYAGIMLNAIVAVLNEESGVNEYYDDIKLKTSYGLGAEGSFSTGFDAEVLGAELKLAGASLTGAVNYKKNDYYKSIPSNNPVTKEKELTLAASYDFSLLSFDFKIADGVEFESDNFSLFGVGEGGEIKLLAGWNANNTVENYQISLTGNMNLNSTFYEVKKIYSTDIIIPGIYKDYVKYSLKNLYDNINPLSFNDTKYDTDETLDYLKDYISDIPIVIDSKEKRTKTVDISPSISLDVAFGVGLGINLGLQIKYMDELEYSKKTTFLYSDWKNYLITSNTYDQSMYQQNFEDTIEDLISGTVPLVKTALLNRLRKIITPIVESEFFESSVAFIDETIVGGINGVIDEAGELITNTFSADLPRTVYDEEEQGIKVKNFFYGEAIHRNTNKKNKNTLLSEQDTTYVVLVSRCLDLKFIPDGDTVSVDRLNNDVTLKMLIDYDLLEQYGFTLADTNKIKLYKYIDSTFKWEVLDYEKSGDTLIADVRDMVTYALAVEIDPDEDTEAPYINGLYPENNTEFNNDSPKIKAHLRDNQFGIGVDFANSFIIINGDTVDYTRDLNTDTIYYEFGNIHYNSSGEYNVKIVAKDFNGNTRTDSTSFVIDNSQSISFVQGWNLFSSYIVPTEPDVAKVMTGVSEDLVIMRNGNSQIYFPSSGYNTIGDFNNHEGYQGYFANSATLDIEGTKLRPEEEEISLPFGWSLIGYLRDSDMNIETALADVQDNLLIVRDIAAKIYYPAGGYNSIGDMKTGQAYEVFMTSSDILTYPANGFGKLGDCSHQITTTPEFLKLKDDGTGISSILIINNISEPDGIEIGAFSKDGELFGSGIVFNNQTILVIHGDNEMTEFKDGFNNNEEIIIKSFDSENSQYTNMNLKEIRTVANEELNTLKFSQNSIVFAKENNSGESYFAENEIYISPNPVNETAKLNISLKENSSVTIEIYAASGQKLHTINNGIMTRGIHEIQLDFADYVSGMYTIMVKLDNEVLSTNVVKVK
jgi:hypothetical protein